MDFKFLKKIFIIILFGFLITNHSFAAEEPYKLLAPLPISETQTMTDQTTAENYIPGIVTLLIGIASVLAVLRIIFAGIKYMSTDAFQGKSEAKGDIQNAIWGLALAMGAWLILNTINPSLTKFNFDIPGLRQGSAIGNDLGQTGNLGQITFTGNEPFLEGCHDCTAINTNVPHKPLGSGCALENPLNETPVAACLVSKLLNQNLIELTNTLSKAGITDEMWWVTEMYPPTVTHISGCHNPGLGGACVDVTFKNTGNVAGLSKFLSIINKSGVKFIYEVETEERRSALLKLADLKNMGDKIKTTGNKEHVHMGFWGTNAITDY